MYYQFRGIIMADIKLFKIDGSSVIEQHETSYKFEKNLQAVIEKNMKQMFNITFLYHEYTVRGDDGQDGRMDSIGIDENNCPVIFEYKKVENENVINQGLFYLDWLLNHKNDFYVLVQKVLGEKKAKEIEWSNPRVICIAPDFSKYDGRAINLMPQNIELIKWKLFNNDLLMFEYFKKSNKTVSPKNTTSDVVPNPTFADKLVNASQKAKDLLESLDQYLIEGISDDITSSELKHYRAYKRMKNFACVVIEKEKVLLFLSINPKKYTVEEGFSRDMSNKGHYGTGDFGITIKDNKDLEKSKYYIKEAYESN